jgi:thiamine monophosphate synthase
VRQAKHIHATAVLLSPVFTTASHPDRKPLPPARIAAMAHAAKIPVIALGGITAANIARLSNSGCSGIAGIGFAYAKRKD